MLAPRVDKTAMNILDYPEQQLRHSLIAQILSVTLAHYNRPREKVFKPGREMKNIQPRQAMQYLMYNFTLLSYPKIGTYFSEVSPPDGLEHTTVYHGVLKIHECLERDLDTRRKILGIMVELVTGKRDDALLETTDILNMPLTGVLSVMRDEIKKTPRFQENRFRAVNFALRQLGIDVLPAEVQLKPDNGPKPDSPGSSKDSKVQNGSGNGGEEKADKVKTISQTPEAKLAHMEKAFAAFEAGFSDKIYGTATPRILDLIAAHAVMKITDLPFGLVEASPLARDRNIVALRIDSDDMQRRMARDTYLNACMNEVLDRYKALRNPKNKGNGALPAIRPAAVEASSNGAAKVPAKPTAINPETRINSFAHAKANLKDMVDGLAARGIVTLDHARIATAGLGYGLQRISRFFSGEKESHTNITHRAFRSLAGISDPVPARAAPETPPPAAEGIAPAPQPPGNPVMPRGAVSAPSL